MSRPSAAPSPLVHLCAMEAGGGAVAYAGKLFADFGETVMKLEPEGSDPMRRIPPLAETRGGPQSAVSAWVDADSGT